MKVLPDNLRDKLKEPIGRLVSEDQLIRILRNEKFIVSIGDTVTYTILKHDIEPVFCVVDYHTRRGKCSEEIINKIKDFGKKTVVVNNPKGKISDELIYNIKKGFTNLEIGQLRIEVVGEEDLASLPAIYYAPAVVTIIYGLPDKGVLVVKPTDKNKEKVREVLEKM